MFGWTNPFKSQAKRFAELEADRRRQLRNLGSSIRKMERDKAVAYDNALAAQVSGNAAAAKRHLMREMNFERWIARFDAQRNKLEELAAWAQGVKFEQDFARISNRTLKQATKHDPETLRTALDEVNAAMEDFRQDEDIWQDDSAESLAAAQSSLNGPSLAERERRLAEAAAAKVRGDAEQTRQDADSIGSEIDDARSRINKLLEDPK
jgi:hypothetical protein